jgi:glycosyltransferase involved in cell wall biosynthesis
MEPTLTIAVPTYNRAQHLDRLLENLAGQRLDPAAVELLVLDNASTDNTTAVVARRASDLPTLSYRRAAKNLGPDRNFKAAFETARGRYLWLIGDDDLLAAGAVNAVLDCIRQQDFDLLYLGWRLVASPLPSVRFGGVERVDAKAFLRRVHCNLSFISAMVFNRERVAGAMPGSYDAFLDSHLYQLVWYLTALRSGSAFLVSRTPLVFVEPANSGGFGLFEVYLDNQPAVIQAVFGPGSSAERVLQGNTLMGHVPGTVYQSRAGGRTVAFAAERYWEVALRRYRHSPLFWWFVAPQLALPRPLAAAVLQLNKAVGFFLKRALRMR